MENIIVNITERPENVTVEVSSVNGLTAYQLYLISTTDDPVLSLSEWISSLNGLTPYIGDNGNWWIGTLATMPWVGTGK